MYEETTSEFGIRFYVPFDKWTLFKVDLNR